MSGDIFYWILNMSLTAVISGAVVLLIRSIRKIPRRIIYILWAVPFLRMLLPYGITSKYSLMNLLSDVTTKSVVVWKKNDIEISTMNSVQFANSYYPITYKVNIIGDIVHISQIVWFVVASLLIITLFIMYMITMSETRSSVQLKDSIYISEKIQSPAVFGIIRPKIIIPAYVAEKDLTFIILHEKVHIRRADNLMRMIAFVTVSIHWFNPLAWIFLRCFLADLELSCDEYVISKCGEEKKKLYAASLVNVEESKTAFISSFGGAKIRTRINNILMYKSMTAISITVFIIFCIAVAYTLLTNSL